MTEITGRGCGGRSVLSPNCNGESGDESLVACCRSPAEAETEAETEADAEADAEAVTVAGPTTSTLTD